MAVRGIHGLGSVLGAVAAPAHPLGARAARSFFGDPALAAALAARWADVARGSRSADADVKAWRARVYGAGVAPVAEPFLYVEVDWQDGTTSRWGEVDRPTADFQIVARLIDVGDLERGFTDDRLLARTTWSLTVSDVGDELGTKMASGAWSRSRWSAWIGYPELPFAGWRLVASGMRVEGAPGRTDGGAYEFGLIDALDDELGGDVALARYEEATAAEIEAALQRAFGLCDPAVLDFIGRLNIPERCASSFERTPNWSNSVAAKPIPVPFGIEYIKPIYAWSGSLQLGDTSNQAFGFVQMAIIGASRRKDWVESHFVFNTTAERQGHEVEAWAFPSETDQSPSATRLCGGIGGYHPPNGFDLSVQVVEMNTVDDGTWYVALWLAVVDGSRYTDSQEALGFRERFRLAVESDTLRFRVPSGAEGARASEWTTTPDPWPHDPVSIALEIIGRYGSAAAARLIDDAGFADAATAEGLSGTWVGGLIDREQALRDVLEALCKTYRFDIYRSIDGQIRIRTTGVTALDMTERIPNAPTWTDDYDLLFFRATPEIGNTRWGMANRFELVGVRDDAIAFSRALGEQYADRDVEAALDLGRVVIRDVDVSWQPQLAGGSPAWFTGALRDIAAVPYSIQRFKVEVEGHLHLLEQDLGAWVRLTHWAGPSATPGAGWTDKLCMVERVRLLWSQRKVVVQLVNRDELDTEKPWVLDDENLWLRLEPKGTAPGIKTTLGSDIITTSGWGDWADEGVAEGDLIELYDAFLAGSLGCWLIVGLAGIDAQVVDSDGVPFSAAATETVLTGWRVWRGHTTAPTNTTHPGRYPAGASMYGRCADETSGQFSNSDEGYVMSGGT